MCESINVAFCFVVEIKNLINKVDMLKNYLELFCTRHLSRKCNWPCLCHKDMPLFWELEEPQAKLHGLLNLIELKNQYPELPLTLEDVLNTFNENSEKIELLRQACKRSIICHITDEEYAQI